MPAWCKVPESFTFSIEYTDHGANQRYSYPDCLAVAADCVHWIIETKGAETVEVAYKGRAARLWCEHASQLTETPWSYLKIAQKDFYAMQPALRSDITLLR